MMASSDFKKETQKLEELSLEKKIAPVNKYFSLALTNDKKTEMYVKFAKVLLIFQGPNFEERNRAVSNVISTYKHSCFIISDESYHKDTKNGFVPDRTEEFYYYFKEKAKKAFEMGYNLIVIDQSMTTIEQIRYFFFLSQQMQYVVFVVPPMVERDLPFVTEGRKYSKKFSSQAESFQSEKVNIRFPNLFQHLFCGWYLHDVDSAELRDLADLYVQDCFENIPDFEKLFAKVSNGGSFKSYYNMVDRRQNVACCIVKVFNSVFSYNSYFEKDSVKKFYGKMSKLYIVGFIVSPHIIAARVKLTHEQKNLWELPDDVSEQSPIDTYPSELQKLAKVTLNDVKLSLISSKSNRTLITGKSISEPTEVILNNSKARSCHIILGKSNTAQGRNIDYDVAFAIYRKRNLENKSAEGILETEDIGRALVQRIGKYWFIYLKDTIIVDGFFATGSMAEKNVT